MDPIHHLDMYIWALEQAADSAEDAQALIELNMEINRLRELRQQYIADREGRDE